VRIITAMPINTPMRKIRGSSLRSRKSRSSAADSGTTQSSSVINAGSSSDIMAAATSAATRADSFSCAIT
jgi:hypothetical protein